MNNYPFNLWYLVVRLVRYPQKTTFWLNHVFLNEERCKVKTKRSEKNMDMLIRNFDVSKPGEQRN